MQIKNGVLFIACLMLLGPTHRAAAQFGFAAFGKAKKNQPPVLDPKGAPPKSSLFDFGARDSVLTFEGPASVMKRFNDSTQHALAEARTVITKPFADLQKDVKAWGARNQTPGNSFQVIPEWMKPSAAKPAPRQPATLGDWLSQERPQ